MKKFVSLILVLSLIFSLTTFVSAEETIQLSPNQWYYDGNYYEVDLSGIVSRGASLDDLTEYVTYKGSYDDGVTNIAVYDNKIILGFYDMQMGVYPNEDGWAIYNMDTETWSGKPSGLPEEFSGSPSNFQIIDNELYVVLINLMYDIYPTIYKSADGINWNEASLIPADEDASSWAVDEINEAITLRLIPSQLQSSYHSTITREEFADLIVNYIDEQNWQGLDVFLENRGVEISEDPFTDTNKESVRIAYSLGIINGKGDHIFDPNGSITREEAAVMLYRVIQLFEDEQTVEPLTFADEDSFASWSGDSVKIISALGIMNGTGDNQFSPSGTYTREQAYMTMVRLFKYLY